MAAASTVWAPETWEAIGAATSFSAVGCAGAKVPPPEC